VFSSYFKEYDYDITVPVIILIHHGYIIMDDMWSNHEPMDSADTPTDTVCTHPSYRPRRKHPTAEELAAESMAADMEKWITYIPGDNDDSTSEPFSQWLANNLPSQLSR